MYGPLRRSMFLWERISPPQKKIHNVFFDSVNEHKTRPAIKSSLGFMLSRAFGLFGFEIPARIASGALTCHCIISRLAVGYPARLQAATRCRGPMVDAAARQLRSGVFSAGGTTAPPLYFRRSFGDDGRTLFSTSKFLPSTRSVAKHSSRPKRRRPQLPGLSHRTPSRNWQK
jgi:hypothetical protein